MKRILTKLKDKDNNYFKCSFLLAIFIETIIWLLIGLLSFPLNEEYIKENYIYETIQFYNNTGNKIKYIVLLVSFIFLFPIIYKIMRKYKKRFNYTSLTINVTIVIISIISLLKYYDNLYVVIIIILFLIILNKIKILDIVKKNNNYSRIFIVVSIISILVSTLYVDTTFQSAYFKMHHVAAYYYPIHKILNGLTLYVDFNSLYGGYSYIFAAILNIFPNTMHLIIFSIITSILVYISLMLTYRILDKIIENKKIVFLIFLNIIFCNVISLYITTFSTYIQYFPHRYLFPIIMVNYMHYYLNNRNMKTRIYGFLLCSIAIFWNLESGLILLIAWVLVQIYEFIYDNRKNKLLISLVVSCFSVIIPFAIIEIITYFRTGDFINIKEIIFSVFLFSNNGFLSLKLDMFDNPWILLLIGYLYFLAHTLTKERPNNKHTLIYYITIYGLGIFIYYLERSISLRFFLIITWFLILVGIYIDEEIRLKKNKKIKNSIIISIVALNAFISMIGTIYSVANNFKLFNSISYNVIENYDWIKDFSSKIGKDNFEMFIDCDIIYYELLEKKDEKKMPAYVDIFTKEDVEKIITYIEDYDTNIILSYDIYKYNPDIFQNDKIKDKYYIYYRESKTNDSKYIFYIRKEDVSKIDNLHEYYKIERIKNEKYIK